MLRSITKVKEMRRALPYSELNVRVARLAVLVEDLRLELYGAAESDIEVLDTIGDGYRRMYFIRRAIMTVQEIKGAMQRLDQCTEFRERVRVNFGKEEGRAWQLAVKFLVDHDADFKSIRNDVGGHFSEQTADYAVKNMSARAAGILELRAGDKPETAGALLKFASHIVAISLTKNKGAGEAVQFYETTLKLLKEALGHITRQQLVLTEHYLWARFSG